MPAESQEKNWTIVAENAMETMKDIQSMIDITTERLVALRDLRLQEFIKAEIRSLEAKLVKQFRGQLVAKYEIPEERWFEDFQNYPSLSQWLTVVGVSREVKEKLCIKMASVESLLSLSEIDIRALLRECGGVSEDERKLLAALERLRGFDEKQSENFGDGGETYWESWNKTPCHQEQNGDVAVKNTRQVFPETGVDYNENIQRVDQDMSKRSGIHADNGHRILVNSASGRTATPIWNDRGDLIESNNAPPSPSYSSRSSLSSTGPPSPPAYGGRNSSASQGCTVSTLPTNATAIQVSQHPSTSSTSRSGQSSLANTPTLPRSSKLQESLNPGASNKSSGIPGSRNLLQPFGQMRGARSYEWQVGSHVAAATDDNLTHSNLSLTSVSTLPPPSTSTSSSGPKLFSARKKHKKRPENIVIDRNEPPDFIALLRPSNRRLSQTMLGSDNGLPSATSGSPVSPRTPMTPGTPINSEMLLQYRDYSPSPQVPQTPKTPGKFKVLKGIRDKIKDKMGKRAKLRRNKSEERVTADPRVIAVARHTSADEIADPPPHHKVRSETFPVINVDGISAQRTNQKLTDNDRRGKNHMVDSHHNSTHSAASSMSSSQLVRMHKESTSFDANLLSSGMTTPGEACMLVGRDNFGFELNTYFDPMIFTGTEKTLVPEEEEAHEDISELDHQQDVDVVDSSEELDDVDSEHKMRANLMRQTSTTSNMHEEWDIPWDELKFQDRIGQGRVGAVYKGKWHGEVAIRVIDICHYDEFKLRAFKHEVMLYKKTRHDNVELFMGSCMNPPRLAIITGFCKGRSLYHYIRANKEPSHIPQANIIAQHVAQGMGYLHSRGIIHKDLKTKNIFICGRRVTVTDFGLMGLHAISKKSMRSVKPMTLQIPDGWLCYMAPEVIKALGVPVGNLDVVSSLPYTKESDMYAFGTVWYELLAGCWPFEDYPAESIIWQVGHGKKQSLAHLQGAKESKDILMACWAYDRMQRPDFTDSGVMGRLIQLPTTKIIRRSSQPIRGNNRGDPSTPFHSVLHELAE